jgi:hypothetical protein
MCTPRRREVHGLLRTEAMLFTHSKHFVVCAMFRCGSLVRTLLSNLVDFRRTFCFLCQNWDSDGGTCESADVSLLRIHSDNLRRI